MKKNGSRLILKQNAPCGCKPIGEACRRWNWWDDDFDDGLGWRVWDDDEFNRRRWWWWRRLLGLDLDLPDPLHLAGRVFHLDLGSLRRSRGLGWLGEDNKNGGCWLDHVEVVVTVGYFSLFIVTFFRCTYIIHASTKLSPPLFLTFT
jgi:hypothetical protein